MEESYIRYNLTQGKEAIMFDFNQISKGKKLGKDTEQNDWYTSVVSATWEAEA